MFRLRCAAKVNLCLVIIGRRPDGYHNLRSLMTAVSLWDELTFSPAKEFQLVDFDGNTLSEDDLVWRSAKLLEQVMGEPLQIRVTLRKRIPSGAGLGGGSSDAAGMFLAVRRLGKRRWSWRQMVPLAVRIGADVPFFLVPTGAAFAEGIGDKLRPVRLPSLWLVLAKPSHSMPTREAFALWDEHPVKVTACPERLLEALWQGDWGSVREQMQNAFEPLVAALFPEVMGLKEKLMRSGAKGAVMTGSGTAVVGIFSDRGSAKRGWEAVAGEAAWAAVVKTVRRSIRIKWDDKLSSGGKEP